MTPDPLAEAIGEFFEPTAFYPSNEEADRHIAQGVAAVRAHIAAVLDAEDRNWSRGHHGYGLRQRAGNDAIANLRATLLGTDEAIG